MNHRFILNLQPIVLKIFSNLFFSEYLALGLNSSNSILKEKVILFYCLN